MSFLISSNAWASAFEDQGFGARGFSLLGAATAEANDYSAVFYNPAQLTFAKNSGFGLMFQWTGTQATVTPEGAKPLDCTHCVPFSGAGLSAGLVVPFGGKLQDIVTLGAGVYVPTGQLVHLKSPDPSRPFWYRFNSAPERLVLLAGLGIKLSNAFRIGIGGQFLANLLGDGAKLGVDLFSKTVRYREVDSYLSANAALVAGMTVVPTEGVRLGLSFRGPVSVRYALPASMDLEGVGTLSFNVSGTDHYTPPVFNLGAAFDLGERVTVTADVNYALWSQAPSPYPRLEVDLSGATLAALGLDEALDIETDRGSPGFVNTLGARAGLEVRATDVFTLRLGAGYRPTPVPLQSVPDTNILDASAIGASLGVGFTFRDPLELFTQPISIDLGGQGWLLLSRRAAKEDADPVPSYTYRANNLSVLAELKGAF